MDMSRPSALPYGHVAALPAPVFCASRRPPLLMTMPILSLPPAVRVSSFSTFDEGCLATRVCWEIEWRNGLVLVHLALPLLGQMRA